MCKQEANNKSYTLVERVNNEDCITDKTVTFEQLSMHR